MEGSDESVDGRNCWRLNLDEIVASWEESWRLVGLRSRSWTAFIPGDGRTPKGGGLLLAGRRAANGLLPLAAILGPYGPRLRSN